MTRIMTLIGAALGALLLLPMQAAATPVTTSVDLSTVFTGNMPDGAAPWLHADFTFSSGSNAGTLTLSSMVSDADFVQGLQNGKGAVGWAFYFNQMISSVKCTSSLCADNYALYFGPGKTANAGSVKGDFNLAFGWSAGNRLDAGDSVTYELTFKSLLNGNPLVPNAMGWSSVAHIQGITGGASCSSWVVAGTGTVTGGGAPCVTTLVHVPEPGDLGLFGFGLLAAGLLFSMRRRYN